MQRTRQARPGTTYQLAPRRSESTVGIAGAIRNGWDCQYGTVSGNTGKGMGAEGGGVRAERERETDTGTVVSVGATWWNA